MRRRLLTGLRARIAMVAGLFGLRDTLIFGGICLIAWGGEAIYPRLGVLAAGGLLVYLGVRKWV